MASNHRFMVVYHGLSSIAVWGRLRITKISNEYVIKKMDVNAYKDKRS